MTSRNIAINQTTIGAVITVGVGAAVAYGLIPAAESTAVISDLTTAVGLTFALIAALQVTIGALIHRKVTPVADPKTDSGTPLVPKVQVLDMAGIESVVLDPPLQP